jgi:hypothetical protein
LAFVAGSVEELLLLARSDAPADRRVAVRELCTCHLRADDDRIWPVFLALFDDEDVKVRRAVLHSLTDSTPESRVDDVAAALERRYHDDDASLRRRIRKTIAHYRRTGKITDAP